MSIKLGSTSFSGIYLGSTKISEAYVGGVKVYSSAPPPTFTVIGGKTYPTVTLPDGHEWLALNLDYAWTGLSVPTSGASNVTTPQAMYYNYDEAYGWDGIKRGLLYNHYAVSYLETNKATLCPGWHVPTKDEFDALETALGGYDYGYKLKSTTGWDNDGNGTDAYGFAGYPSGYFSITFRDITLKLYFWTQTTTSSNNAWAKMLSSSSNSTSNTNTVRGRQYSVRLIKDY